MKYIKLGNKKKYAIVDDDRFNDLSKKKWFLSGGYARRNEYGKCILMHRLICETPDGKITDHINGNRLDNRKVNLRVCNIGENNSNAKLRSDSTTKLKGVSFHKRNKKYIVYINANGKRKHIGYFDSLKIAGIAYNKNALRLHKEFAFINKI
jgi:hypothetical protein